MSSFRSRARRLAFGDSHDSASETSSRTSSIRSTISQESVPQAIRHSSSISEQFVFEESKAAHIKPKRTNRVRRINRSQPFEIFVEALEADGCVIVQDFVSPEISQRVNDADTQSFNNFSEERQSRSLSVDVNCLIRESLFSDSLFQTLSTHFLSLETISWQTQQINLNTSKPQLSSSSTRDLNAFSPSIPSFQRADAIYHKRHTATTKYEYQSRRDTSLGLFVPELDSLSATIDISAMPGSHLWDDQKPDFSRGVKELELRSGEALILLGSLYHCIGDDDFDVETPRPGMSRSSSNGSCTRKEKLTHEIWMCSGIYRPASELVSDDSEA